MTMTARAELMVTDSRIRVLPPSVPNTAGFFVLTNHFDETIVLVGAESEIAEKVEIHTHSMRDGVMKMSQIPSVTVDPHQSVEFKSGGLHLMFFNLKKTLKVGDKVAVNLIDANGKKYPLHATAIKPGQHKKSMQGHSHH